jgi:hypothetical protein
MEKGQEGREIVDKNSFYTPILQPIELKHEKWVLIYDSMDYDEANHLLDTLKAASIRFGCVVEDPYWIEVARKAPSKEWENETKAHIEGPEQFTGVVCLLPRSTYYAHVKRTLDRTGVVS